MDLLLKPMDAKAFGARLRNRRESLGFKQAQVAKAGGISRPAVSQWENGETEKVDAEALCKIADFLETTSDYLLFGKPTARIVEDIAKDWYKLTTDQREYFRDQVKDKAVENEAIFEAMRRQRNL